MSLQYICNKGFNLNTVKFQCKMSLHCLIEYLLLDYGMNPDCLKNAMSACDLEIMKAQSESPCHLIQVAIYMQNEKCIFALCNCYHGHDL